MKQAIALGLLTVLLVIGVSCFGTPQGASSSNRFETFTDWCRNRDSLTPEAPHTVEKLLEEAETQACDQANSKLTNLTLLFLNDNQVIDVPRSPEQGADTAIWLATLPADGVSRGFFRDRHPIEW